MMRVLQVHNYYQRRGGEDETADQEVSLLRQEGHEVEFYSRHNDEIRDYSILRQAGMLFGTSWSRRTYREVTDLIGSFSPDIVHVQNFFPLISPSVFYACRDTGTPVCLTLHDYRLVCPIGWLYRAGSLCTECIDHSPLRSVRHKCYRNSRTKSLPIALMLMLHSRARTWTKCVTAYSAMTQASKDIFVHGGLPPEKILIRPHFLDSDPGAGEGQREGVVFVGRLSAEKGLNELISAWQELPGVPLKVIGDGPLRNKLEALTQEKGIKNISFEGFVEPRAVFGHLKNARLLVMPSQWHETFGRTIMEAFATATPVAASNLGAMTDLVEHGKTGLLFRHDSIEQLRDAVTQLYSSPVKAREMGARARKQFEQHFSLSAGARGLLDFYRAVIKKKKTES